MDHPPDSRLDKDWWNVEARSTPQTRCRDFKPFLIHSGCVSGSVILLRGDCCHQGISFLRKGEHGCNSASLDRAIFLRCSSVWLHGSEGHRADGGERCLQSHENP